MIFKGLVEHDLNVLYRVAPPGIYRRYIVNIFKHQQGRYTVFEIVGIHASGITKFTAG